MQVFPQEQTVLWRGHIRRCLSAELEARTVGGLWFTEWRPEKPAEVIPWRNSEQSSRRLSQSVFICSSCKVLKKKKKKIKSQWGQSNLAWVQFERNRAPWESEPGQEDRCRCVHRSHLWAARGLRSSRGTCGSLRKCQHLLNTQGIPTLVPTLLKVQWLGIIKIYPLGASVPRNVPSFHPLFTQHSPTVVFCLTACFLQRKQNLTHKETYDFWTAKETTNKTERPPTGREKYLQTQHQRRKNQIVQFINIYKSIQEGKNSSTEK